MDPGLILLALAGVEKGIELVIKLRNAAKQSGELTPERADCPRYVPGALAGSGLTFG
jgi:hypothetical protein